MQFENVVPSNLLCRGQHMNPDISNSSNPSTMTKDSIIIMSLVKQSTPSMSFSCLETSTLWVCVGFFHCTMYPIFHICSTSTQKGNSLKIHNEATTPLYIAMLNFNFNVSKLYKASSLCFFFSISLHLHYQIPPFCKQRTNTFSRW